MDLASWSLANLIEQHGERIVLTAMGAAVGVLFGIMAQRSRFCLRAAVIEFWHRRFGEKLSVWLLTFATAVVAVQGLILLGALDVSSSRQLSATGSLSGAIVGGLLFGAGMVMTRGCASRLLVLAAQGNLRALLSGLIFAVTAQAALGGALAPARLAISQWWTVDGGAARDVLALTGIGHWGGLAVGLLWVAVAIYFGRRSVGGAWKWVGGVGVGLCVALAWWLTYSVSKQSFEVVTVQGLTFSGPAAEWLMRVVQQPPPGLGFDAGLLPGVFIGALAAAWFSGDWQLEGFKDGHSMRRYIVGAIFMGFGAMLAGGCAIGAGVTGSSVFSLTAWFALCGMWLGAGVVDRVLDSKPVAA